MDAKTRTQLIEVNRAFYEGTADAFSDSRSDPWPGWARAIDFARPRSEAPMSILDVGCGNGRFAAYLRDLQARGTMGAFRYLGVDSSPSLLSRAKRTLAELEVVEFVEADVLDLADMVLPSSQGFDLIVAFGILHHIPGFETRRDFVQTLVSRLRPGGVLVVTAWQFGASERFRSRTVPWSHYNEDAISPIDEDQLEAGDALLRFGDSPHLRYCHFVSQQELRAMFSDCEIEWLDDYCADGKTNDLNRYAVVSRSRSDAAA